MKKLEITSKNLNQLVVNINRYFEINDILKVYTFVDAETGPKAIYKAIYGFNDWGLRIYTWISLPINPSNLVKNKRGAFVYLVETDSFKRKKAA